ncbi:uncharacterized protein B0H64DRAFT_133549 [Chaetomium fimeti]|uniref:Uncharacterized protein n=1 Tax=Chaetomium fimeti TaxID=1854472 RepID=A0AAE0HJU5_9PEZI|nr:hypothetical protein B0H64DRAFT_133549 [Chaetomium fimeti]
MPAPGRETPGRGCKYLPVTYFVPWRILKRRTQRTSQEQGSSLGESTPAGSWKLACSPGPWLQSLSVWSYFILLFGLLILTELSLKRQQPGATIDGNRAREVWKRESLANSPLTFPPVQEVGKETFGHLQQTFASLTPLGPRFNSTRGAPPGRGW